MRILVTGSDIAEAREVQASLDVDEFDTEIVPAAEVRSSRAGQHDAMVVSATPPELDGPAHCRSLRALGVHQPILLISSRRALRDRVAGLEAGADDYLTRPFAGEELRARLRALLRRYGGPGLRQLVVNDLTLDPLTRQVYRGRRRLDLTGKEFKLLEYLMRHSGRPVSRDAIGGHVWGAEWDGLTNVIDVFVCRLRKKVEPAGSTRLLHAVRGVGYLVAPDAEQAGDVPA